MPILLRHHADQGAALRGGHRVGLQGRGGLGWGSGGGGGGSQRQAAGQDGGVDGGARPRRIQRSRSGWRALNWRDLPPPSIIDQFHPTALLTTPVLPPWRVLASKQKDQVLPGPGQRSPGRRAAAPPCWAPPPASPVPATPRAQGSRAAAQAGGGCCPWRSWQGRHQVAWGGAGLPCSTVNWLLSLDWQQVAVHWP